MALLSQVLSVTVFGKVNYPIDLLGGDGIYRLYPGLPGETP